MVNKLYTDVGPLPPADCPFATVQAAIAALSSADKLARLAFIAQKRLDRLAYLPPGQRLRAEVEAMELVNEAIRLVQQGAQQPGHGRTTHTRHLRSSATFFNYLQSVIQSCISSRLKRFVRQGDHTPIGDANADPGCIEPHSSADVVREVQLRETKHKLVQGLGQAAEQRPSLRPAVAEVQATGLEDHFLPQDGLSYKQVHDLRQRSQAVLRELASLERAPHPTGKEVLGF